MNSPIPNVIIKIAIIIEYNEGKNLIKTGPSIIKASAVLWLHPFSHFINFLSIQQKIITTKDSNTDFL